MDEVVSSPVGFETRRPLLREEEVPTEDLHLAAKLIPMFLEAVVVTGLMVEADRLQDPHLILCLDRLLRKDIATAAHPDPLHPNDRLLANAVTQEVQGGVVGKLVNLDQDPLVVQMNQTHDLPEDKFLEGMSRTPKVEAEALQRDSAEDDRTLVRALHLVRHHDAVDTGGGNKGRPPQTPRTALVEGLTS